MTQHQPTLPVNDFSSPPLCRGLLEALHQELDSPLRFMEVCGTHTVAIFRSGLRSMLPAGITHLSGPGCPVCVTHESEVAAFIELAHKDNVTVATFGDLMRVPGPNGASLKKAQAAGASVHVVYSPLDALALAKEHPHRRIVFLGVGFETTAPTVAATIKMAQTQGVANFSVLSFHKLVPPALHTLLADAGENKNSIDAFLLPGHVSTILGLEPYNFIATTYKKPGIVGGFDPADILQSLLLMVRQRKQGTPAIVNQYSRAVSNQGNPKACQFLHDVFSVGDARWRGLGLLPQSGLFINEAFSQFDAWQQFDLHLPDVAPIKGCQCGDVLKGIMQPLQCPLFGKACTPATPVGPCMVSTEGSCAAYYAYQGTL